MAEARRAVELQRGEVDLARTAMLCRPQPVGRVAPRRRCQREKPSGRGHRANWPCGSDRLSNAGDRIAEVDQAHRPRLRHRQDRDRRRRLTKLSERRGALSGRDRDRRDSAARLPRTRWPRPRRSIAPRPKTPCARPNASRIGPGAKTRARLEAVLEGLSGPGTEETAVEEIRHRTAETEPAEASRHFGRWATSELPPLDGCRGRGRQAASPARLAGCGQPARRRRMPRKCAPNATGIEPPRKTDLDEAIAKLRQGYRRAESRGPATPDRGVRLGQWRGSRTCSATSSAAARRGWSWSRSEDPLDAGLEILCQPPGKKLSDALAACRVASRP